jgi:glutathione S-transferase
MSSVSKGKVDTNIRLYTYAMSPFASKTHCFLLYKKLDFECFYINPLRVKQDLPVGKQIPVLTVGDESRADSTPIGLWLDELFPDHPRLLPGDGPERERLLALDRWVSDYVIPRSFRFYPGDGIDRVLNSWKLSRVMANTARGGLPLWLRIAWPLVITRVPFARRLRAMGEDGLPIAEAKRASYRAFLERLEGGPFLAGRDEPSLPDLAAYPQFALFYLTGFRGGDDILRETELMAWLRRMTPFVSGTPPLMPAHLRRRELP